MTRLDGNRPPKQPTDIHSLIPLGKRAGHRKPCVLFIEDDTQVRDIISSVLEYMDFEVVRCNSAPEAATAVTRSNAIDLVISDISIAGSHVCQMIADVCEKEPDAAVLFASGHGQDRCSSFLDCGDSCPIAFLSKPFSVREFQQAIQSLLIRKQIASRCNKIPTIPIKIAQT